MALAHTDNFNCSAVNNTGLSVNNHMLLPLETRMTSACFVLLFACSYAVAAIAGHKVRQMTKEHLVHW